MITGRFCKRLQVFLGSTLLTIGTFSTAMAAPGTLADRPLFVGSQSVNPNIMFLLDDSGSMGYGTLFNKGTAFVDQGGMVSLIYEPGTADYDSQDRKYFCAGYNVMAYNPKVKYTPWKGVDSNGDPYPNYTIQDAQLDPYNPSNNNKQNLSSHKFYIWNDTDQDGMYDDGECDTTTAQRVNALDPVGTEANPNSQQNYANWFSYYRTREFAMKAAMSEVISSSNARVGFKTLHDSGGLINGANNTQVDAPATDLGDANNKADLLNKLFQTHALSGQGTPLRSRFEIMGNYFMGNNSPILGDLEGGQCQRNFAVVMSDGFWNGDSNFSIGDLDGDTYSNTLADVAYNFYNTDLKPTYENKVPSLPGIDENTEQHLVTYTVAFGVNGNLDCNPPEANCNAAWPQPVQNDKSAVDDMRHAAWNGHGKFLSASNPQALTDSLKVALSDISAMSGTLAPVTFNTTSLLSNSLVFQAEFDTSGWRGDLVAREITNEGLNLDVKWSAATKLNALSNVSNRKIYTFDGTDKVDFAWANLTAEQKADLLVNKPTGISNDTYGNSIVAYFEGDHSNEGTAPGQFRPRNNQRLGDIVHSGPTYVGVPNASYPDDIEGGIEGNVDKRYSTFKTAQSDRTGLVYIGANDGAFHAFNGQTGEEEFAYIPSILFSDATGKGLHALAEPGYDHNYYVDLSATAADVYIDNAWRTVIVGGLRGGGKGLFALDITDENLDEDSDVLFEFTDVNLGYTYSEIQIAKMNNGKWAAIFGNGYNNNGDGKAKLFIVYLDTGTPVVLDTGVGTINTTSLSCDDVDSDCNGLSTPTLGDLNGDNIVDRIVAGDVQGNLWAFDVSSDNPDNWGSAYKDTDPVPLFVACSTTRTTTNGVETCPSANRQPITSKPSLAWHPTQRFATSAPNILVFFGTGQFLTTNDMTNTDQQNFYGIWDKGQPNLDKDDLQLRTVKEATYTSTNPAVTEVVRVMDQESPINYGTKVGWNIQLPTTKERVVTNPTVYGDVVFFSTLIPGETQTLNGNPCDGVDGGSGWLMAVKLLTGGQPDFSTIDLNGDYIVNGDDALTDQFAVGTKARGAVTESRFIGNQRVTPGESRTIRVYDPNLPPRSSWTVQ